MGKGRAEAAALAVGGCVCCVLLITSAILFGVSWSSLEPNEVGIEYNGNTLTINQDQLFEAGRHFLGLGHSFIVYPKTLQVLKFSNSGSDASGPAINARTKDGLVVSVSLSFNFKLQTDSIAEMSKLYLDFGEMEDVKVAYNRIARNWVRAVAANFTAFEFFFNRSDFQSLVERVLNVKLREAHASVDSLQLLGVDMPARFNDARVAQETAVQAIEQAQEQKQVAKINAATEIARAAREAEVIVLKADSTAQAITLTTQAKLAALKARYEAEQESYKNLAAGLGLSADQLLAYIWLDSVREGMQGTTVKIDMPDLIKQFDK